jgi:uncharacterized membrane protein (UPF0136 family)
VSRFPGRLLIAYGLFLMLMGLAGFLSNPEKAKTALLSGGSFGLLSIAWGALLSRGVSWARNAGIATTILLAGVFTWRAAVGWIAVFDGRPEKRTAALLITGMLLGSLATLVLLLRSRTNAPPRRPSSNP